MSKTGQKVKQSGIYECRRCSKRATFVKGRRFSPCSSCKNKATWVLTEKPSDPKGFLDWLTS